MTEGEEGLSAVIVTNPHPRANLRALGPPQPPPTSNNLRIGLIGSYLNPEVLARLHRLADKLDQVAAGADVRRSSRRDDRQLPGGLVPRTIMRLLAESVEPLSVPAIHEAVELTLGVPVSRSTVKNALAREARSGDRLVRLARGRYRLLD